MKPYLPLAARLSSLRRIEFCRYSADIFSCANDQNIVTIKDAIEFVKIHVETFGDILTEIKVPDFSSLDYNGIPSDIQILDIINILKQPQVIELGDSYNVCQYLQGPSTDYLRVFSGPFSCENGELRDWDWNPASLFQRCPKLENVSFKSLQSNSFKWAVERRYLCINSGTVSDSKLPPLQYVNVKCQHCAALPMVQDILYAFRNTVKSIVAIETEFSGLNPEPLCWDWLLPNLVQIHISGADLSLFEIEALNLCSSLEDLNLTDKYVYRSSSTVTECSPVLKLPKLRKIQLMCTTCYKFNFDSLKYSPLLESLILFEMNSALPIRPSCLSWTWDWRLPHLKVLDLTGEPAILFQFRLLDSCPPLQRLRLETGGYCRELSLEEILSTDTYLRSESVNRVASRCVFSRDPEFFLCGKWKLSEKTLSALLLRYMPHVKTMKFADIEGLTVSDVIRITQQLSHAKFVSFYILLNDADIKQLGMELISWNNRDCRLCIGSIEYTMGYKPKEGTYAFKYRNRFARVMPQR
ncbi:hypothetical protein K7432_003850 [Basidiobolus ranarum]|uniref:Uncharacterized protein n=1 Tax=Basidiobolus ranarum TaxID=34480 RepID=A0ABR2WZ45_9FUNG